MRLFVKQLIEWLIADFNNQIQTIYNDLEDAIYTEGRVITKDNFLGHYQSIIEPLQTKLNNAQNFADWYVLLLELDKTYQASKLRNVTPALQLFYKTLLGIMNKSYVEVCEAFQYDFTKQDSIDQEEANALRTNVTKQTAERINVITMEKSTFYYCVDDQTTTHDVSRLDNLRKVLSQQTPLSFFGIKQGEDKGIQQAIIDGLAAIQVNEALSTDTTVTLTVGVKSLLELLDYCQYYRNKSNKRQPELSKDQPRLAFLNDPMQPLDESNRPLQLRIYRTSEVIYRIERYLLVILANVTMDSVHYPQAILDSDLQLAQESKQSLAYIKYALTHSHSNSSELSASSD